MFTESGLRLSELVNVCPGDIDWHDNTIRVIGKGRKEALAPMGKLTRKYLEEWLKIRVTGKGKDNITGEYVDDNIGVKNNFIGDNIWDINKWGVISMLRRLEKKPGYPRNPHVFRRNDHQRPKTQGKYRDSATLHPDGDISRQTEILQVDVIRGKTLCIYHHLMVYPDDYRGMSH